MGVTQDNRSTCLVQKIKINEESKEDRDWSKRSSRAASQVVTTETSLVAQWMSPSASARDAAGSLVQENPT